MMTVAAWLVYSGVIAAVLTAGAFAWEVSARWSGGAARWGWLTALTGSVTLPWLLRLVPERAWSEPMVAALHALPTSAVVAYEPLGVMATGVTDPVGWSALQFAVAGWVALSALLLLYVLGVVLSLSSARRRWRAAELEGGEVWLSRDVGPAALGLREGIVVVPSWALELADDLRALLLLHEREHVRAGDPRLLFAGLLCVVAMPWNPLVWLQLLRLRNAIELDCDARVLSAGADPRSYGSLLLEVGRRRSSSSLVMATFAEPRLFLEERIRRIARYPLQRSRGRSAAFAVMALLLFTTALSARDPLRPAPAGGGTELLPRDRAVSAVATPHDVYDENGDLVSFGLSPIDVSVSVVPMAIDTPPAPSRVDAQPTFTPMTNRPELRNAGEVRDALRSSYPPMLRDAGVTGTATVWFFIDDEGVVRRTQLSRSSGYPALDEAAMEVASVMNFSPARNRGERVSVWVEIPVSFGEAPAVLQPAEVRGQPAQPPPGGRPAPAAVPAPAAPIAPARPQPSERPAPAAVPAPAPPVAPTRAPAPAPAPPVAPARGAVQQGELVNRAEVQQALERAYPPLLRDAGVGGAVVVWYFVDENGRVLRTQVGAGSGRAELDQAALSVASIMRFAPYHRDGAPAQAWMEVPIVFGGGRVPLLRGGGELVPVAPIVVSPRTMEGAPLPPARAPLVRTPVPAELAELARQPVFTPMTQRPELQNQSEVQRALVRNYPPLLRDAGIGGSPVVWFLIDSEGRVVKTQISHPTAHPALDEAALAIASVMQFSPARNRDQRVPVWVEIPIVFIAR